MNVIASVFVYQKAVECVFRCIHDKMKLYRADDCVDRTHEFVHAEWDVVDGVCVVYYARSIKKTI